MTDKIIRLRCGEGVHLTADTQGKLANLFGVPVDWLEVEHFVSAVDVRGSYTRRKQSVHDAFEFILQAWPLAPDTDAELRRFLAWCDEICQVPDSNKTEDHQPVLAHYTALLANAIIDYWPAETNAKAVAWLNRAEQYDIQSKGRPDLATLTMIGTGEQQRMILQWERQLPPCTEETLKELRDIKNSELDVTPGWFRSLTLEQQIWLHHSDPDSKTPAQLAADLLHLQSEWKAIRIEGETAQSLGKDLLQIKEGIHYPAWFTALSPANQLILREIVWQMKSSSNSREIDNKLQDLSTALKSLSMGQMADLAHLRKLPYWYVVFPDYEQRYMRHTLLLKKKVEDTITFIPSRSRMIPGLPNFCESRTLILSPDADEIVVKAFHPQLRSSHLASRDLKGLARHVVELHSNRNSRHIVDTAVKAGWPALLIQTLVSPNKYLDGFIPDYKLDLERQRVIKNLMKSGEYALEISTSNHPLNHDKYWDYTTATSPECKAILASAKRRLELDVIKSALRSVSVPEEDISLYSRLIKAATVLIETCPNNQMFDRLKQLAARLPLKGQSLDECSVIIKAAWANAEAISRDPASLANCSASDSADDQAQMLLTDFFVSRRDELKQVYEDWQGVLAGIWYLSANQSDYAHDLRAVMTGITDLARVVRDYTFLLNKTWIQSIRLDRRTGRELWLSSLEGLMLPLYGSCISGKDRKPLAIMHLVSMWIYHDMYGIWPHINDTGSERANFVDIVSELFVSIHAQVHSGQNAKGSEALKNVKHYFPPDICAAIYEKMGRDYLDIEDRIASNNELKDMGNLPAKMRHNFVYCANAALKLSEEARESLLTEMRAINEELPYWAGQTYYQTLNFWGYSAPTGVGAMKDTKGLLPSQDRPPSSTELLAEWFHTILSRSKIQNAWRTDKTQRYYDCVTSLIESADPNALLAETLVKLGKIKAEAFESNKSPKTSPEHASPSP